MERESLVELVRQCLGTFRGGLDVAEKATAEISKDVHSSDLRDALVEGNQISKTWSERCDMALQEVGGSIRKENPVMKAHYDASKRIRSEALEENARDLGIIAHGQLCLHYWISAFGTLRTYAQAAGLSRIASDMEICLNEAKDTDEMQTQIAVKIMGVSPEMRKVSKGVSHF